MDVALPNELSTKAQWDLLRGFALQLRDTYGAALCVSLHHPNAKGDHRNVHAHIFMTSRAVDEEGNFSKRKIRQLDDRKLGPPEVERIREMWEIRCNRALKKAGFSEGVTRQSLKAQAIKRPASQHLGPRATAIARSGCLLRKAEANREISSASCRMTEIEHQLQHLRNHAHSVSKRQSARPQIRRGKKPNLAPASDAHRSSLKRKTYGVALRGESRVTYHGNRPPGNHPRAAACIFGLGTRVGSSPCPRSFNRTNCSRPLLPGRSIACRAPANRSSSHPSARNRPATTGPPKDVEPSHVGMKFAPAVLHA